MAAPAILSLATGVPQNRHKQMDIHDRWLSPFINSQRARAIFAAAEIDVRYSVLADSSFLADEPGTLARNKLFLQAAQPLAIDTINRALTQAKLRPTAIDHFIVISCTGFDTPGLDVILASDLDMRSDLRRSALIGMGCFAGLTGIDLTQYREDEDLIPVTLRTVAADRQDFSKLDGLSVYSQATGSHVPLTQVARVSLTFEPGVIERRDRDRTMSLNVQLVPSATAAEVVVGLKPWLEEAAAGWPAGHGFELGGETEESGDANASIAAELPAAGMLILLLLVGQFNSLRRPAIILSTIPLGLIGVTFGLLVANSSFGFFTILGLISLSGIIINNAIVLLDRIAIEIREFERTQQDAVITACQQRLRPILLTTATTVLGMTPLLWGGTAMFKPMAITIIFGLAFATALTLLVVPVLYSLFFRVRFAD